MISLLKDLKETTRSFADLMQLADTKEELFEKKCLIIMYLLGCYHSKKITYSTFKRYRLFYHLLQKEWYVGRTMK